MKHGNSTLTFLDLVFSLLGATTILTVILSVTAGRANYRLKQDYVMVTVRWKAGSDGASCNSSLSTTGRRKEWTYAYSPPAAEVKGGKVYESVYYAAPVQAGTWRVSCVTPDGFVEAIRVESKRGPLPPVTPSGTKTDILIETTDES